MDDNGRKFALTMMIFFIVFALFGVGYFALMIARV